MSTGRIFVKISDRAEVEVLKHVFLSHSGATASVDIAMGPIVVRGILVSDGRDVPSNQPYAILPNDVTLSEDLQGIIETIAMFVHIVEDFEKATWGELKQRGIVAPNREG